MTQKELDKVLENHQHWLDEDCDGWEDMRANLDGENLKGLGLVNVNLSGANLENANLTYANLAGANLKGTNLAGANLTETNFASANLKDANLGGANLRYADLHGAHLRNADLHGADLQGAEGIPFIPFVCPDTGSFIAYKKARGYIVKLQISEDAKRLSATSRKCRCDKAQVLEIQNLDGTTADITKVGSNFDGTFIYEVGKTVSVDNFDENRWDECSTGIHFFVNRQEAVNW